MELIDTHAHLDDEKFQTDLPAVLDRARTTGVARVVAVATTGPSSLACVQLAGNHALLRATVGIQPNHVAQAAPDDWDQVVALASRPEVVALGETGLDRYWDYTPFSEQEDFFARHLALARQLNRAVVIHCRQAEADVVRMLRADFEHFGPVRGVMHSFTGDLATARACLAMGLYISFAGMLTYKNAQALRAVAAQVPLDRLLVETDAPYLAPVPVRGQRNEPSFVRYTAHCLAEVKEVPLETIAEYSTRNARALFGIL
ncbi:MAG TPA: TatD family hydrolase [Gemmataceae bacterium]|jgi:TatD DNase family protein|nr:TatD family hydrolase [Gemmataceae bacterium]